MHTRERCRSLIWMTTEAWRTKKGFLVRHGRGLIWICVCMCVCRHSTSTRHCSAIPFSPWHAAAFTNPHCRTEQVWLCIQMEGEGDGRETVREGEGKTASERQPGRKRETKSERWKRKKPLSSSLTSAVSLSPHPSWAGYSSAVHTKGFSFPGFPPPAGGVWGRGEGQVEGWRQVAADWQSGGAAELLCFVLITISTASKNGRRIDWGTGSVCDVRGCGLKVTQSVIRAELQ